MSRIARIIKKKLKKYETVALIKDRSFGRTDLIKTRREQK